MNDIEKVIRALADREREYEKVLEAAVDAEHTYEIKFAAEIKKSSGSNETIRKAEAKLACNAEFKEHLTASAKKAFLKEKIENARAVLSARQSILSSETKTNAAISRFQT